MRRAKRRLWFLVLSGAAVLVGADACGSGNASAPGGSGGTLGWFQCAGCLCNGATHYCYGWTSGAGTTGYDGGPVYDPDAACPEQSSCIPLPPQCAGNPSCECLGTGCSCGLVADAGYSVQCYGGSAGI
jgi:hypothetical protein